MLHFFLNLSTCILSGYIFFISLRAYRSAPPLEEKPLKVILYSIAIVLSGFLAFTTFKWLVFGNNYVSETKSYLEDELTGHDDNPIFLSAMRAARKATGFELTDIDVDHVWGGKYYFHDRKLPFNIYEVNVKWKNRAEDVVERECFMFSYANDDENGYLRKMRFLDGCSKEEKNKWVSKVKDSLEE
ncbi:MULTISPECIES: hypothetical protein [Xenorhabdus]|uniref:hypothetical protein n=1 Tax=Xenorhabdus TaxID=626 RepID=UPI00064AAFC9|nr:MULTISPECIES: hypothetical protein [Xenorhabdus]KLU17100.1 hypothetical protein AAY47_01355 [Xenorhabdus griffiniae]KOP31705.1 hypothetical protein AFK69_19645 [Xenorhabdus sp. GDc328]